MGAVRVRNALQQFLSCLMKQGTVNYEVRSPEEKTECNNYPRIRSRVLHGAWRNASFTFLSTPDGWPYWIASRKSSPVFLCTIVSPWFVLLFVHLVVSMASRFSFSEQRDARVNVSMMGCGGFSFINVVRISVRYWGSTASSATWVSSDDCDSLDDAVKWFDCSV